MINKGMVVLFIGCVLLMWCGVSVLASETYDVVVLEKYLYSQPWEALDVNDQNEVLLYESKKDEIKLYDAASKTSKHIGYTHAYENDLSLNNSGCVLGKDANSDYVIWSGVGDKHVLEAPDVEGLRKWEALDLNDSGAVGWCYGVTNSGLSSYYQYYFCSWDEQGSCSETIETTNINGYVEFVDANNHNQIIIKLYSDYYNWNADEDTLVKLETEGYGTCVYSIDDEGTVVGYTGTHAVSWDSEGHYTTIDENSCTAYDINDSGVIVGEYYSEGACLWTGGTVSFLLDSVSEEWKSFGGSSFNHKDTSINNSGSIATTGITDDGQVYAVLLVPATGPTDPPIPQDTPVSMGTTETAAPESLGDREEGRESPNSDKAPDCSESQAGDPVYTHNGQFYLPLADLNVPGEPVLFFKRVYSTQFSYNSVMGYGWTHNYNERLYKTSDGNVVLRNGDWTQVPFTNVEEGVYRNGPREITELEDGTYAFTDVSDGYTRMYDASGLLVRIQGLVSNALVLSYSSFDAQSVFGRSDETLLPSNNLLLAQGACLSEVRRFAGGNDTGAALSFSYGDDGRVRDVIATYEGGGQRVVSYEYAAEGQGNLVTYADPVGRAYIYEYDDSHRMTRFTRGGCACAETRNYYDLTDRVVSQNVNGLMFEFTYESNLTKVTTGVYNDQTGDRSMTRHEYYHLRDDGKLFKHVLQMGNCLDSVCGEDDDIVTVYEYNEAGEMIEKANSAASPVEYVYDDDGRIIQTVRTNSSGTGWIDYVFYDPEGRVTNSYSVNTDNPGEHLNESYAVYDSDGRLMEAGYIGSNGERISDRYQVTDNPDGSQTYEIQQADGIYSLIERDAAGNVVRVADKENPSRQTLYQYDEFGRVTRMEDAGGGVTTYEYDENGNLLSTVDPSGFEKHMVYENGQLVSIESGIQGTSIFRKQVSEYDDEGRLLKTWRVDEGGQSNLVASYQYDGENRVLVLDDEQGDTMKYEYDPLGRTRVIENRYGLRTTNEYDRAGRLIRRINPGGLITRRDYDNSGRLIRVAEGEGLPEETVVEYRYNADGRASEMIMPDGNSVYYSYDAFGQISSVTGITVGALGYSYDAQGRLVAFKNPSEQVTSNRYNSTGTLAARVFADGSSQQLFYDDMDNLVSAMDEMSNRVYYAYDELGRLTGISAPNSSDQWLCNTSYTPWGDVTEISTEGGVIAAFGYDSAGRVSTVTNGAGFTLQFEYADEGHLAGMTWPDGTAAQQLWSNGLLRKITDRLGRSSRIEYDELQRPVAVWQPGGMKQYAAYNAKGQVVRSSNTLGVASAMDYDLWGRVRQVQHNNMPDIYNQYEIKGNLVCQSNDCGYFVRQGYDPLSGTPTNLQTAGGFEIGWGYDVRGRVVEERIGDDVRLYCRSASGIVVSNRNARGQWMHYFLNEWGQPDAVSDENGDYTIRYEYDDQGRVTLDAHKGVTNTYRYDMFGRIVENQQQYVGCRLNYEYDSEGKASAMKLNGVELLSYEYGTGGLLEGIRTPVGDYAFEWDPELGLPVQATFPDGKVRMAQYDAAGRLLSVEYRSAADEVLLSRAYQYSLANLITNSVHEDGAAYVYGYTADLKLSSAQRIIGGQADAGYAFDYQYDLDGNVTQSVCNGTLTSYDVNRKNQLTAIDAEGQVAGSNYDADGNILNHSVNSYGWSIQNQLLSVSNEASTMQFRYDAAGRLVETVSDDGDTRRFLYDGQKLLAILDGNNQLKLLFVYGPDVSSVVDGANGIGGLLALHRYAGGTINCFSYGDDGRGNVVRLWDGSSVVASYQYSPYGDLLEAGGSMADENIMRFSSKPFLNETGLYAFGLRYYAPRLRRWLSRDPLGLRGGLNLYAYAGHDPVNCIDPLGTENHRITPIENRNFGIVYDQQTMNSAQNAWDKLNGASVNYKPVVKNNAGGSPCAALLLMNGMLNNMASVKAEPETINNMAWAKDKKFGSITAMPNVPPAPDIPYVEELVRLIRNVAGAAVHSSGGHLTLDRMVAETINKTVSRISKNPCCTEKNTDIQIIAHSQGTAIIRSALTMVSPENRAQINYNGVGSEIMVTSDEFGLRSAMNWINMGDPVPSIEAYAGHRGRSLLKEAWEKNELAVLPEDTFGSHAWAKWYRAIGDTLDSGLYRGQLGAVAYRNKYTKEGIIGKGWNGAGYASLKHRKFIEGRIAGGMSYYGANNHAGKKMTAIGVSAFKAGVINPVMAAAGWALNQFDRAERGLTDYTAKNSEQIYLQAAQDPYSITD